MSLKNSYLNKINFWKLKNSVHVLRISLGIIFFWFGFIKFFPNVSVAESIAGKTISTLTFGLLQEKWSMPLLATWECAIGLGLLTSKFMKATLTLLYIQMFGTFLPFLFFPEETWKVFPFVPSLMGQYIIKNCVLISAGIVLGTVNFKKSKEEYKID